MDFGRSLVENCGFLHVCWVFGRFSVVICVLLGDFNRNFLDFGRFLVEICGLLDVFYCKLVDF